jgi:tetratricopeptide (TPR) repeat protein
MVGLGVIYSELLQRVDKFQDALDILEKLPADEAIQIATCEIENQLSLYEKVLETTEVLHSADTVHEAILQVYRGIALRGTKNYLASIEVLTAAAKVKGNADVKNLALLERARTYQSMGDQAKALKDIQKILVTDTDFPGVEELRKELEAKP